MSLARPMQQADEAAAEQAPPVSTPPTAAIVNGADRQQRCAQHMQLPHHKRDIISQFMRYTEEISGLAISYLSHVLLGMRFSMENITNAAVAIW